MKLIIARHGQTIWNTEMRTQGRTDIPLSATGQAQAERLSALLAGSALSAVYCSPLQRAVDTAEAIAAPHGIVPCMSEALMERDFGLWEGLPFDELKEKYPEQVAKWEATPFGFTPPGAEPLSAVLERSQLFLETIHASHESTDVVAVVGHSIPSRLLICHLIGLDARFLHNIRLDNASYTEVRTDIRHNTLHVLNSTAHLRDIACG